MPTFVSAGAAAPLQRPLSLFLPGPSCLAQAPSQAKVRLGPPPPVRLRLEGSSMASDPLALAILKQSKAHPRVRGAAQRARFQEELAEGRGPLYAQVFQNMARRIHPPLSRPSSSDTAERFSLTIPELALVAYQVALAFDAFQAGRPDLARDHVALLASRPVAHSLPACTLPVRTRA